VTGNLKFDLDVPATAAGPGARRCGFSFGASRRCGSPARPATARKALILDALATRPLPPGTLTVVVPRHPQRFDAVAALLRERGIAFARRSDDLPVPTDARVVLGDSMGEMLGYCAAADVVFVGGSLLPLGGQKPDRADRRRPADAGRPAHVQLAEATANALAAGAALHVDDAAALVGTSRGAARRPRPGAPRWARPRWPSTPAPPRRGASACGSGSRRSSMRRLAPVAGPRPAAAAAVAAASALEPPVDLLDVGVRRASRPANFSAARR